MRKRPGSRNGQALIMVTMALLAMSGLIGMVIDFGWSYYTRRASQAAADSAALAGARAAMDMILAQGVSALSCTGLSCGSETSCGNGLSGTWGTACQYAQQNGFSAGGDSGRQQVTVAAGVNSPAAAPPTAPNVYVRYWVTVRVSTTVPQLYSALLGNATATVAARATAAITDFLVNGSVIAMNREGDPAPTWQNSPGTNNPDVLLGTNALVWAPIDGGIVLASNDAGAGTNLGTLSPISPYTNTRGNVNGSWGTANVSTSAADSTQFVDPYRGMGQPPLPTSALHEYPVEGGNLAYASACASGTCPPGVYYATSGGVPTGGQLAVSSPLNFSNGGTTWGDYVFYGGLNITGSTVNFGPGRYVLAGVLNSATSALNIGGGAQIGTGTGADAGRLFIVTDPSYPGLSAIAPLPAPLQLTFGPTTIDAGSNGSVTLYGLNPASTLPSDQNSLGYTLSDFGPVTIWQDQRFSNITNPSNTTPQMVFGSTTVLDGIVYQPRGAWMQFKTSAKLFGVGGPTNVGGARLFAGALDVGASSTLQLCRSGCSQSAPLWNHTVALVE
ncbi:MAG TPA: pilus assembly protein TadG-related protein [Bryobacteraceae bacterium]|nr:pilus assembly protein TadG-related protein [Bryobacteraceae bacterium]